MLTPGVKTNCRESSKSYLDPVEKYITFFKGLRPAPRLFVSGIWTMNALDSGGTLTVAYSSGGSMTPFLNRSSSPCATSADGTFIAQPQLRLSKFARGFKSHNELDICNLGDYESTLEGMASSILFQAGLKPTL